MSYKNISKRLVTCPKTASYTHFGLLFYCLLCILVLNKNITYEKGSSMQATIQQPHRESTTSALYQLTERPNNSARRKRSIKFPTAAILPKRKGGNRRK